MRRETREGELSGNLTPMPAPRKSGLGAALAHLRSRIIAGLLLVLPFVVTFWIVYWLYTWLDLYLISPMSRLVIRFASGSRVDDVLEYVAPLVGLVLVGVLLYFLGFVARSRVANMVDNFLLRVPVVTKIYRAVSRMFNSLSTEEMTRFKRVVLVTFPHPGMRVPAFVTASCQDEATGKTILCVYLPTTPIPTSGYLLMVPEDDVTDIDWTLEETIQTMVSFGLSAPDKVQYFAAEPTLPKRAEKAGRAD